MTSTRSFRPFLLVLYGLLGLQVASAASCDGATKADIQFYTHGIEGSIFAACFGADKDLYYEKPTPQDFARCNKDLNLCATRNASHMSVTCVRGSKFCRASRLYCERLNGVHECYVSGQMDQ